MIGRTHPRRTALLVAALCAVVTAGGFAWTRHARPVVLLGPMVQQVTTDGFALFVGVAGADAVTARLHRSDQHVDEGIVNPQGDGRFIITFAGLEPGQTYEYELTVGGTALRRHRVRTAPADGRAFRFIALGDTGVGDRHQFAVARQLKSYRADFIVHTGDLVYPRGRLEDHPRKFFQPYADLLPEIPIHVALGNHEYRIPEIDPVAAAFVFPPNGPASAPPERSYWFDYGNARFVVIDSNNDEPFFAETVAPWLDETLRAAEGRWKIVCFHEPVYTQGKYPPAAKLLNTIVPVLETRGTHLVLCGHNHMYERSRPMRGGQVRANGEGTVYVTTGAGGANLAESRLPMPDTIAAWEDRRHSFTVADVTRDVIRLRQIDESGRLIDEYHLGRTTPASAPPPLATARD